MTTDKLHDDITCTKYGEKVLLDENGQCSLCGANVFTKINYHTMNNINIYRKEVYGTTMFYIVDFKTANAVRNLTGAKTQTNQAKSALEDLGFTFTEVINPN